MWRFPVPVTWQAFLGLVAKPNSKTWGAIRRVRSCCKRLVVEVKRIKLQVFSLQPGCFMASIDLKDAYYSVSIANQDRKYLKFSWRNNLYQFTFFKWFGTVPEKENSTYKITITNYTPVTLLTITNCTLITLLTITNCTLITLLTITKWILITLLITLGSMYATDIKQI